MKQLQPDYIFEASWEVCNRIGGIYTVLSTRANTLSKKYGEKLIFIGPDVWKKTDSPYFIPSQNNRFDTWTKELSSQKNIQVRVGNWDIPGKPMVFLVNFDSLFSQKNELYKNYWDWFGVNSLHAYGDYDESSMFGYACGCVIESFVKFNKLENKKIAAHFNEWMTGFGELYLRHYLPQVATLFTTHATSIGRSIAGNNKPLYDYLASYNGDQMAHELNMEAKHSIEKTAAHFADCFTTVSDITGEECTILLDKKPDIITPNGFENDFVPSAENYTKKRKEAKACLRKVAEKVLGYKLSKNPLFVGTSGRYEFKNKGIDVFIDALKTVSEHEKEREIVVFLIIPANTSEYKINLKGEKPTIAEGQEFSTHYLHGEENDPILNTIKWHQFSNKNSSKLKIIFIPSYLERNDGIFNKSYYDILIGLDLTVFPSYYEPWGYTPLESVAFGIPTITTDKSGFGKWVSDFPQGIESGVGIIHRSDYNSHEVAQTICNMILNFATKKEKELDEIKKRAFATAENALWKHFILNYYEAYQIALTNKEKRIKHA